MATRKIPSETTVPLFPRFIRAEIRQLQTGSLLEAVSFAVATAIADPNVIAVLQNLGANVVWAIGTSGLRGIRPRVSRTPNAVSYTHLDVYKRQV